VRGVRIRRRDFAGGILSSGIRRQRHPISPESNRLTVTTPESTALRCFVLAADPTKLPRHRLLQFRGA
jgi:hypothetical protein